MNVKLSLLFLPAISLASAALPAASAQAPIPLDQAIKDGKVTVEIRGLGGSTGDAILIAIQRKISEPMRLTLNPGTVFKSVNGKVQNMLAAVIKGERIGEMSYRPTTEIVLSDMNEHTYVVEAYCLDFHKANPGPSDSFSLTPCDQGALSILRAGKAKTASIQAIQAAIWIHRDGVKPAEVKDRFGVSDADLAVARQLLLPDDTTGTVGDDPRRERKQPASTSIRTWRDSSGKFSVKAELVDSESGRVRLKKTDGAIIAVSLDKLCNADRAFLEGRSGADSENQPAASGDTAVAPLTLTPLELAQFELDAARLKRVAKILSAEMEGQDVRNPLEKAKDDLAVSTLLQAEGNQNRGRLVQSQIADVLRQLEFLKAQRKVHEDAPSVDETRLKKLSSTEQVRQYREAQEQLVDIATKRQAAIDQAKSVGKDIRTELEIAMDAFAASLEKSAEYTGAVRRLKAEEAKHANAAYQTGLFLSMPSVAVRVARLRYQMASRAFWP